MQLVGIKELKNKLTYYLGLTKKGDRLIVTDRGIPTACGDVGAKGRKPPRVTSSIVNLFL